MNHPILTVVITSYNYSKYIGRCVESILSQDFENFELIILDNDSSDDTFEVISKYLIDERVCFKKHNRNVGSYLNFNLALRAGEGRYLSIVSADDYLLPGHFSTLISSLQEGGAVLAYSPIMLVDDKGVQKGVQSHPGYAASSYQGGRDEFSDLLVHDCYITLCSVIFDRERLTGELYFDGQAWGGGDWELFIRLALKYRDFSYIGQPTSCYRIHADQYSNVDFYSSLQPLYAHLAVLEKFSHFLTERGDRNSALLAAQHLRRRIEKYDLKRFSQINDRLNSMLGRLEACEVSGVNEDAALVVIEAEDGVEAVRCLNYLSDIHPGWRCVFFGPIDKAAQSHIRSALSRNVDFITIVGVQGTVALDRYIRRSSLGYLFYLSSSSLAKTTIKEVAALHAENPDWIGIDREGLGFVPINYNQGRQASGLCISISNYVQIGGFSPVVSSDMRVLDILARIMLFSGALGEGINFGNAFHGSAPRQVSWAKFVFSNVACFSPGEIIRSAEILLDTPQQWFFSINKALIEQPTCGIAFFMRSQLSRLHTNSADYTFTIVMTTYNRTHLLHDALMSVVRQELQDFEVVLVNDHGESVEDSLQGFDFPITYVRQSHNQGPAAARNVAHRLARGRYIVYLDDDDIFLPDHLQTLANALQEHPGEVVYSDALFVAERIENGVRHSLQEERRYPHEGYSRERLFVDNYIPVNTFAWPRAVAAEVGEFDETLSGLEDWDFLLRLAAKLPFHHVQRETVQVRMRVGDAAPDRRSLHAFKNYPSLYRELYSRHSDLDNASVKSQRAAKLKQLEQMTNDSPGDVVRTWLAARQPNPLQQRLIDEHLEDNQGGPRIGVLVLDLHGHVEAVTQTLASVRDEQQGYRHLEAKVLTVGDFGGDALSDVPIQVTLENYVTALNQAAAQLDCDWCLLVQAGERFTASGLLIAALELIATPDCRAIYTDEIQITSNGELLPILRPDFNLDLLLSFPASMGRHWLFRRDVFTAAGGFDHCYPGALEFELVLRLIEQGGLAGLGHVSEPLLVTPVLQLEHRDDEVRAIRKHLGTRGYAQAEVVPFLPGRYRLEYGHATAPGVSIVIPAFAPLAAFQRCMESILEMTRDVPYELLLVPRKEQGDEMVTWLNGLKAMGEANVRVLDECAAKGLRASQNYAAQQARGDYLLFVTADTAVVMEDWLTSMLNHAQRPEVGAVGVKMVSSAGAIQHAGIVLGLQGPASSPFVGEKLDASGYMNRLEVDQNYSAVSDACLMIAREKFLELDGLDESSTAEKWAGLDLCLKAKQAGYLNVWTPHVSVLKDGSDEPLSSTEQDALYSRWLPVLARDPAYNRNFSLVKPGGFKLADNALAWRPTSSWKPLPKLLVHPGDMFGCGHYRMLYPFQAMQSGGLVEGTVSIGLMHPSDLERYEPDAIILQRQIGADRIEAMRRIKAFSRAFKVYELDDYLPNLPVKSEHRKQMPKDIVRSLRLGLGFVDRFVVSTEPLADAFSGFHSDIVVMPNRLPLETWGSIERTRIPRGRMRVGWAGGSSHTGDLALIADVVKELAKEVDWVFFGMCPDSLRPYVKEWHKGVSIENYASTLAALDLDLAIAPLEHNAFNACKSNLKLLEYGACGYPVVCTDIEPYRGLIPVTRVKNRFSEWVDAIRGHIAERDAAERLGRELRTVVRRDWLLDTQPLDEWHKAWTGG